MKKHLYIGLITLAILSFGKRTFAQDHTPVPATGSDYQLAAGLKFGPFEIGPSIKYFFQKDAALEGVLGFRKNGIVFTGLYEQHMTAFNVTGLKFFYGGGAHFGGMDIGNHDDRYYATRTVKFGIDGLLGLEYKLPDTPVAISLDVDPRIEFVTGSAFDIAPGLGVKYTFR